MKLISTKAHGILDYLNAIFFIAIPFLLRWEPGFSGSVMFIALGVMTFLYSIFTDYEAGLSRLIPFRMHLWLDLCSGILLAAAPWIFGFAHITYVPHLACGLFEVLVVLLTNSRINTAKA